MQQQDNPNIERGRRFYRSLVVDNHLNTEPGTRYEDAKKQLEEHKKKLNTMDANDPWYPSEQASIDFYKGFLSCFD